MLKAYRYRIYPNKEQEIQLAKTFGCCRFVYNQTLAYRKDAYEKEKKSVSKTDCNNYCNRELKKAYRPEFINRIDEKVVFHSLSSDHMQEVVKIMVKPLVASLAEKGIDLKLQASALKLLANQGYDPEMGARPLRRTLQTEVEDKLAELLLKGDLVAGSTLKIGVKAGQLKFDIA